MKYDRSRSGPVASPPVAFAKRRRETPGDAVAIPRIGYDCVARARLYADANPGQVAFDFVQIADFPGQRIIGVERRLRGERRESGRSFVGGGEFEYGIRQRDVGAGCLQRFIAAPIDNRSAQQIDEKFQCAVGFVGQNRVVRAEFQAERAVRFDRGQHPARFRARIEKERPGFEELIAQARFPGEVKNIGFPPGTALSA